MLLLKLKVAILSTPYKVTQIQNSPKLKKKTLSNQTYTYMNFIHFSLGPKSTPKVRQIYYVAPCRYMNKTYLPHFRDYYMPPNSSTSYQSSATSKASKVLARVP